MPRQVGWAFLHHGGIEFTVPIRGWIIEFGMESQTTQTAVLGIVIRQIPARGFENRRADIKEQLERLPARAIIYKFVDRALVRHIAFGPYKDPVTGIGHRVHVWLFKGRRQRHLRNLFDNHGQSRWQNFRRDTRVNVMLRLAKRLGDIQRHRCWIRAEPQTVRRLIGKGIDPEKTCVRRIGQRAIDQCDSPVRGLRKRANGQGITGGVSVVGQDRQRR